MISGSVVNSYNIFDVTDYCVLFGALEKEAVAAKEKTEKEKKKHSLGKVPKTSRGGGVLQIGGLRPPDADSPHFWVSRTTPPPQT